jgi:hypothetical protein
MRRTTFVTLAVVAAISVGTLGCEDGPNQTYSPTPAGLGNEWNGTGGSSVDPATKDFGYLHGGTNAALLCDGPTLQKTWANMDNQPIIPPVGGAGINMAGPNCSLTGGGTCDWQGLTIEQADKQLCQSTNLGDLFGDGELTNAWGDSQEVLAHYLVSTHKINFMVFLPGYNGAISAQGCKGTVSDGHSYVLPIYTQVQKDGNNWEIDWNAPKGPNDWRNEVTSALLCTYAPTLAVDPDCNTSGRCIQGNFGDVNYLFVPVLGTGLWVLNANAPQPQASILFRIDGYLSKVLPYAGAGAFLKIDDVGPTATPPANGGVLNAQLNQPCVLKFGLQYKDFIDQCVKVHNDPNLDTSEFNKLLGGLTHTTERFSFDVQGIDINFSDDHLQPDQVVLDTDLPQDTDTAGQFIVDQSSIGPIVEDFAGNDPNAMTSGPNPHPAKDLHGAGLVYLQYARRAQRDLEAAAFPGGPSHYIGDMNCANGGSGCTGLETILTGTPAVLVKGSGVLRTTPSGQIGSMEVTSLQNAALTTDPMDPNAPDPIVQLRLGLKLGHQKTVFCPDHSMAGLQSCDESTYVGDVFSKSYSRVCSVLAGGGASCPPAAVHRLPLDARDNRFFFKEWVQALVQYMKAEGEAVREGVDPSTITIADVDAQTIDEYSLYFDSVGAGQFETAEYIERSFVNDTTPPIDFVFEADVKNGILDAYVFSRYLYRGERALYAAMTDNRDGQDHPLGSQETALLTNMFGSPVLRNGWHDVTASDGTVYTAYHCATVDDPTHCNGQRPPIDPTTQSLALDQEGNPLLSRYEGAFGSNATVFTLGGGQSTSQPVPITLKSGVGPNGDGTFPDIESAMMTVPLHRNPYDLTSAPPSNGPAALDVLVPWLPKQPGVGFPVALDGQRDRFIETYQADFSGTQVTANIDYDFALDQQTHQPTQQLMFLAVETTDFLGDVFICQDPKTKDLLRARMYTSVETILDWIAQHPNTYDDCQIIIHYSPYENYADYINSLQNGVRLGVTQGGGYGRIVDGTLYDPTLPGH